MGVLWPGVPAGRSAEQRVFGGRIGALAERPLAPARVFVAAAIGALILVIPLAMTLSFQGDEWAYIVDRRLTIDGLLRPHNEHLAALHVLVYRSLVELFGTGSYLPYLLVLMAVHVSAAAGVYVLLRRSVAAMPALGAAVLMLFLFSGYDNLLWAFQIGFAGSIALGIWALAFAHRPWISAALLTAAVWTQGPGLFFVPPACILVRRRLPLLIPVVSYAAWLVVVGRGTIPPPDTGPYLAYVASLLSNEAGGISGGGQAFGPLAAVIAGSMLAIRIWDDRGLNRFALAGLLGLITEAAILAFGRAHFGPEQALSSRYVYAAAPFVFMTLTAFRSTPKKLWVLLFAIAFVGNLAALPRGVALYQAFLHYDRSIPMEQRLAPFR